MNQPSPLVAFPSLAFEQSDGSSRETLNSSHGGYRLVKRS